MNTYMKKQRESLMQFEPQLSDLSERSNENSDEEVTRMNSINMIDEN